MAIKMEMNERLKKLLEKQKRNNQKRKMGNTSNVWSKDDLAKSTIVIGD